MRDRLMNLIAQAFAYVRQMRGLSAPLMADFFIDHDVTIVTHCADCQHCALDYADRGFGYPTKPIRVCIIHDHETTLDDYCSWARRKDGADE